MERHKQICWSSYVWYHYPVALKVNSVFLLERTVLLVIETRFQVYKATGSAIVVTCMFWRNCNSSLKKGPRSLAITMRVAMIYKTLVVAVLQLSRRRVYNVSIREPSPHPGYRYNHYWHGYFATCSLFLRWHSDWMSLLIIGSRHNASSPGAQSRLACTIHSISSHNKHIDALWVHNDFYYCKKNPKRQHGAHNCDIFSQLSITIFIGLAYDL